MKFGVAIILLSSLLGCASEHKPAKECCPATQPTTRPLVDVVTYEPAIAHPLAFDPSIVRGQAPIDLARESRSPSAFVGYEDGIASYFYIRVDDSQSYDNSNFGNNSSSGSNRNRGMDNSTYQRRTVIETAGVRYR
jgi:hypothetical protein